MLESLAIRREGTAPVGRQLEGQIEGLIHGGQLLPGALLPTVRDVAKQLGLNYNTVAGAYRSLEKRGYLALRRGGGSRVSASPPFPSRERRLVADVADRVLEQVRRAGLSADEFATVLGQRSALVPAERPLRIVAVGETQARADELSAWFIGPVGGSFPGPVEVRARHIEDFRGDEPHDLVVTHGAVIERARSANSGQARGRRTSRDRLRGYRQSFLLMAEGAD